MFILSAGVPKEKLILGIPTYGLSFVLNNENKYSIGDKITEQGSPGRMSDRSGFLATEEVNEVRSVPFTSVHCSSRFANKLKSMVIKDLSPMKVSSLLHVEATISFYTMIHNHYKSTRK